MVPLCRIGTHEIAPFGGGCIRYHAGDNLLDGTLLHNCETDFHSVCGGLLGPTPASERWKVRLGPIDAHRIGVFCGRCIRYQADDILLDGRLLHDHFTDLGSLCGILSGSTPASQRYKLHLSAICIHDVTGPQLGGGPRRPDRGLQLERVFCQKAPYAYRCFYVD